MPNNVTVTMTSTLNFAAPVPPETSECPERGRMEVDHSAAVHPCTDDQKDLGSSGVQEEIEQRWHQVETTPLREEKQVPINTALGTSDRLPAHELAALLDKEVGLAKCGETHSDHNCQESDINYKTQLLPN